MTYVLGLLAALLILGVLRMTGRALIRLGTGMERKRRAEPAHIEANKAAEPAHNPFAEGH